MATTESAVTVSMIAGAAFLAADIGKLVEVSGPDTVTIINATTDTIMGVLAEVPIESGKDVPIALLQGVVKVQAGGVVAPGQILVPAADGQVTAVADINSIPVDSMGVGIAKQAGVDGEIIEMIAMPLVSTLSV